LTAGGLASRVIMVAAAGSFASSLASSIVGVALPGIGAWAGVGVADVQWVMLGPLLAVTATLLPAGRVGDLIGHRKVYVCGLAVAGLGCLLGAASPTFLLLVLTRALTGIGAGMCMAASPALVSLVAPKGRRGGALGFVSTGVYLGLTLGPPLGGLIETSLGFRAIFWAQTVIFFVILVAAWRWMPEPQRPVERGRLEWGKVVLAAAGLAGVVLAFARHETWEPVWTVVAFVAGSICLFAFFVQDHGCESPMLDFGLFRERTFASGIVAAALNYLAMTHATFLLPFVLEDGLGMSSRDAGVVMVAMPLLMTLTTGPSGNLSDRVGSRGPAFVGMAVSAVALTGLALAADAAWAIAAWMCLLGLGTGVFVSPNTNAIMSSAPRGRQGGASGLMALARNVGMLVGTTSAALIFDAARHSALETGAAASEAVIAGASSACLSGAVVAATGAIVVLVTRPRVQVG